MLLYNSLTKTRDEFIPNEPGKVKMYTCGPTVYHFAHIGNLRTYIMEDTLEKYLRYVGYDVTRVMNITDVGHLTSDADEGEDKMLKGARREHKTVMEIAQFYTDAFFADCKKLNIKTPDIVEPATGCIDDFIKVIEPTDVADLQIIDGGDYCTLFTCTPYGINTHRLLVRGIRIETIKEKPPLYVSNEAFRIEPLLVTPAVAAPMLFVLLIHLLVKYREPPKNAQQKKKQEGGTEHEP